MPRVLIAEDEPAAARYLKSLVEAQPGFEVVALAAHGEEALSLARDHRPDLVLTDVRMPILDGLGLARRLRQESPGLAIVIVSGHQEFEYARQALALGVVDYLLKPVDPAVLGRLLGELKTRIQSRGDVSMLEALSSLVTGAPVPEVRALPSRLLAALVRWGGPFTRPTPALPLGASSPEPGFWTLAGRDAREVLLLADADQVPRDVFEARVKHLEARAGRATG